MIDDVTLRLIAGALTGAAVGLERQWSAQATARAARFGGLRTFTCIGIIGAIAGWLWTLDATIPASLLIGATAALVVAGYVAASRVDVDATTEVAALVVLAASVLAGLDRIALAGGLAAATTLLLAEKSRLHAFVARIDGEGFLLAPALVLPLTVRLAPAFVVGLIAAAIGLRRSGGEPVQTAVSNPLQLGAALQMAAIFQVVLIGLHEMQQRFGGAGLRWSAVLLGLTDVDALTASMATQSRAGLAVAAAAAAIAIGVASNTVLKLAIAVTVGRGVFRWYVAAGLAAVAAALVAALRLTHGL